MLKNVPLRKVLEKKAKSNTELEQVEQLIKANKHKRVDRRLQVIKLHQEGKSRAR